MARHQTAQQSQLSVKKMRASRHDGNWQRLRPRPIEHINQGDGIVVLPVYDQRRLMQVQRQRSNLEAARSSAHQHDFFDFPRATQGLYGPAGDKCAKRESSQGQWPGGCTLTGYGKQIVKLPAPLVINARTAADAPEIESYCVPARLDKGARQRLYHFVVHSAAKKRMRMGNDRYATRELAHCWRCVIT